MQFDGLDDLERRGRWAGRPRPQAPPARTVAPAEPPIVKRRVRRQSPVRQEEPAPPPTSKTRVERVVVYLSQAQTEWIREQQIEGLRKRKRVSASQLIRELLDRALLQSRGS